MNNESIGALWVKQSPKGQYMTGTIELEGKKISIVCFLNDRKTKDIQPDWRILISQRPDSNPVQKVIQTEARQEEMNNITTVEYPEMDTDASDIPF